MIDLHMHILPGIDDGAETMEEAVEMAWCSVDSGVRAVAATSHIGPDFRGGEPEERRKGYLEVLEEFQKELHRREIPLLVYEGMEILAGDGFTEALCQGRLLTLNKSRYILTEFFFDENEEYISETVYRVKAAGYKMVMAHPERYGCVRQRPQLLYEWKKEGCIFQLNKGSLFGAFGSSVKRTGEWILKNRLADVVASDAHDTVERPAGLEDIQFLLEDIYGLEEAKRLLSENPRKLLFC